MNLTFLRPEVVLPLPTRPTLIAAAAHVPCGAPQTPPGTAGRAGPGLPVGSYVESPHTFPIAEPFPGHGLAESGAATPERRGLPSTACPRPFRRSRADRKRPSSRRPRALPAAVLRYPRPLRAQPQPPGPRPAANSSAPPACPPGPALQTGPAAPQRAAGPRRPHLHELAASRREADPELLLPADHGGARRCAREAPRPC